MITALSGIKIAVVGGDDREIVLMSELAKMGATVTVTGFPRDRVKHGISVVGSVDKALKGVEVAIFPLPGTSPDGVVRAVFCEEKLILEKSALNGMHRPGIVIIGTAREFLKKWTAELGLSLLEIAEMDEVAILNSIPTAEGAIQMAMAEVPITLHGSKSLVIGLGRVGQTLAHKLKALSADVVVITREPSERARAYELGCKGIPFDHLGTALHDADLVFNTVPSMVLGREVLKEANPEVLIIDLAASPGGTDFEAANALGIRAMLAPGLPGKVAPISAGKILAEVIPPLILDELSRVEGNRCQVKEGGYHETGGS